MSKHRAITSILLALILTSSAFFVILSYDGERGTVLGQVGTSVGGILLDNTVWTPNGSPYNFVNDVIVAQNSTLTITPGTVVNIGLSAFIINGTLNARGNSDNRIVFEAQNRTARSWPPRIFFNDSSTPWNENTGTGCIIDYAQINVPNWQYETIMGAYPKISNNIIYNYGGDAAAVRINGLVENNTIMGGYRGIVAQFNEKILSNTIEGATAGISCGYMSTDPIYHPTIIGNVLTNNYVGIDDYGCAPYIANNTITANQFGFYFTSYTFYGNAIPDGIISNNIDNNNYNVLIGFTDSQKTINMANNWWGTTESAKIADSIYDNTTNSNLNKVNYIPFLTQPNPLAPSNSSTTIPSPSPTPISTAPATPAPTSTPLPFPSPTLALSCASTTSYSTLNVEISGNLTDNGNNIPSVPIFMMYSVTGGNTWESLTDVNTASDGSFSVQWHPSVTGNYMIKATFNGDSNHSPVSTVVNLAIMPYTTQNTQDVFSVASNSTVSSLAFNSTSRAFSFTVSGPSGTSGYVNAFIDKSLIADISTLSVYLDGNQQAYVVSSQGNSWIIYFTYHHSTHSVVMNLDISSSKTFKGSFETALEVGLTVAVVVIMFAVLLIIKRKQKRLR